MGNTISQVSLPKIDTGNITDYLYRDATSVSAQQYCICILCEQDFLIRIINYYKYILLVYYILEILN